MAGNSRSGSDNGMLYMIVGALVLLVAIGGFMLFGGKTPGHTDSKSMNIKIELPALDRK